MTNDGIIAMEDSIAGAWPSGKATDFESVYREFESLRPSLDLKAHLRGDPVATQPRIATVIDWLFAPDWLSVEEACFLTGHSRDDMLFIVEDGGVDLDENGLIEKESLYEFLETLVELLNWSAEPLDTAPKL